MRTYDINAFEDAWKVQLEMKERVEELGHEIINEAQKLIGPALHEVRRGKTLLLVSDVFAKPEDDGHINTNLFKVAMKRVLNL